MSTVHVLRRLGILRFHGLPILQVSTLSTALLFSSIVWCEEPTTPGNEKSPADWIKLLNSADSSERDQAEQELIKLGRQLAEREVKAAIESGETEQKLRAQAIMDEWTRNEIWQPSRVALTTEEKTLFQAYRKIEKQTSNSIDWSRTDKQLDVPCKLTLAEEPFWSAVGKLGKLTNVMPSVDNDKPFRGYILEREIIALSPTVISGPIRLRISSYRIAAELGAETLLAARPDPQQFTFDVDWEERLKLCRVSGWPRILEAKTDTEEDLRMNPRTLPSLIHVSRRQRQITSFARIRAPNRPTKKLKKLVVQYEFVAAADITPIRFENLHAGQRHDRHGFSVEIKDVKPTTDRIDLLIRLNRPLAYDRFNSIEMVDEYFTAENELGKPAQVDLQRVVGNRHEVEYLLSISTKVAAVKSLTFHFARLYSPRTIDFTFENLSLQGGTDGPAKK